MAWDNVTESAFVFECDTCEEATVECDVAKIREECFTVTDDESSDFAVCWRHMQSLGWKGFKRVGHDWTHHCPACIPVAEGLHSVHRTNEIARDRQKARNGS